MDFLLHLFGGTVQSLSQPNSHPGRPVSPTSFGIERMLSNNFTVYPERLLVYHGGTGRTVFAGCLKVTTIFIFSAFALFVAPTHFYAEAEPPWVAPAGMF